LANAIRTYNNGRKTTKIQIIDLSGTGMVIDPRSKRAVDAVAFNKRVEFLESQRVKAAAEAEDKPMHPDENLINASCAAAEEMVDVLERHSALILALSTMKKELAVVNARRKELMPLIAVHHACNERGEIVVDTSDPSRSAVPRPLTKHVTKPASLLKPETGGVARDVDSGIKIVPGLPELSHPDFLKFVV